jgi:5-methyltetrahydrofolate--homocysteine methyltransferase
MADKARGGVADHARAVPRTSSVPVEKQDVRGTARTVRETSGGVMNQELQRVFDQVVEGNKAGVETAVRSAVDAAIPPARILQEGLIAAMSEVGDRFEKQEFYVPEMLVSARAMQAGLALLKPQLVESGVKAVGKVVLGTVRGDLHDIGKSLVGMMLEGAGFEVVDLGTDVAPEKFGEAVRTHRPQVVGMSALLTTTMQSMRSTLEALDDLGVRGQVKVMVGGAPVTESFAREIGADGYAPDASRAVALAKALMRD